MKYIVAIVNMENHKISIKEGFNNIDEAKKFADGYNADMEYLYEDDECFAEALTI